MSDQPFLQLADSLFDFEVPDWDQFNFESLVPYTVDYGHTLAPFPPLQPPTDFYSLLLSPPGSSEPSTTATPSPPTPDLPLAGSSSTQPPITTQLTPSPPTPPAPAWQPTPQQILNFDFCPFTRYGRVCGHVSWARSANKQIKRHVKAEHFPDTSLGYECPNPECIYRNYRFLRKDACNEHRKMCDLLQAPGYVLLPNVASGSDAEVDRWMKARRKQRRSIITKLRNGTPWSEDLLEPVCL